MCRSYSAVRHKSSGGVTTVIGVYILRCFVCRLDVNEWGWPLCASSLQLTFSLSLFLSLITMDSFFIALCMTFLVASLTRRSGAIGPVIRCEPCDIRARLLCKPLPKDCTERVREPGCGCCMTCALSIGQPCGVYTRRCSSGLTCQHQPGETKPLQALLEGRGVCVNSTNRQPSVRPTSTPPVNEMPGDVVLQCKYAC